MAEALLGLLPQQLQVLAPCGIATLAALHDVGKVSPGFQAKSDRWLELLGFADRARAEKWSSCETDHSRVSQATVARLLGHTQLHDWARAVGMHHGRRDRKITPAVPWEKERRRLAEELVATFGPLPAVPAREAQLWFAAGLITVADWIGSNETYFPQDTPWDVEARRHAAREALEKIGWRPAEPQTGLAFQDLFPHIPSANNLQAAAVEMIREPGVYIVEGPMGCGKTEAALAAAYELMAAGKASGIYFALPTQVTSNRIHLRVQPFVERISNVPATVRLAHGTSWLLQSEPPVNLRAAAAADGDAREHAKAGRSWFASAKRALLMPYGIGTVDQALLGIVAARHFFLRQFGLAGKVVILDEVHSYDLYTGTLIRALVERLRELRCTVIILSATLTEKRRRELLKVADEQPVAAAYPLISAVAGGFREQPVAAAPGQSVRLRHVRGPIQPAEALAAARSGCCVLWIRNTVDDAQATYEELCKIDRGGTPLALLHSRFPLYVREQLESDWMQRLGKNAENRPAGCVLVATQVAEQSVDIDADLLITDLAPTDMLLQRLGRLWRHDRSSRPLEQAECWIQMPDAADDFWRGAGKDELRAAFGKSARVYAPYVLLRSLIQWRSRRHIALPSDIRTILERTYEDARATDPPAWAELRAELDNRNHKMAALAMSATAVWAQPDLADDEGVQTRYNSYPSAELLLVCGIDRVDEHSERVVLLNGETVTVHDGDWSFATAKALQWNLVRVPRWAVEDGFAAVSRGVANHVSQRVAIGVVRQEGAVLWPGQTNATRLTYCPKRGIVIDRKERADEPHD